ncbi:hypothetical protein NQZ68_033314 [Dissostichus eleginoides]|nr:hypothetical protein NQZ68_033314 [Dissostichus eleginoides]
MPCSGAHLQQKKTFKAEVAAVGHLSSPGGGQRAQTLPPALCSCPCWQRCGRACQSTAPSHQSVTISWKPFNKPKPSVRETKACPQHGLAQNAAIHREGEAGALAKPFMDREKGSVTKPCSIKALIHQGR